ncbi:MAG: ABC transporter permease [candidate division Zixibacteria bacterium]|nr:ABC transporter permease [candidate division Zixibacteria bacterium]
MSLIRIWALARKETIQILRDKRSLILAFLLPLALIFLFGFAITLDIRSIPTVVLDYSNSTHSRELIRKFTNSGYFEEIERASAENRITELIDRNRAKVGIIIPVDFADRLASGSAAIQTLADGSDANTSQSILAYTTLIVNEFNLDRLRLQLGESAKLAQVNLQPRFWYNPDLDSQNFLVPGLIALIMTILGSLLTSLTIAREWERGTMELLISTPVKPLEMAIGKLAPYYVIGMVDLFLAAYVGVVIFEVPFNGSLWLLTLFSTLFLLAVLANGYLISVVAGSQQLAYQLSMLTSFLPGFLLSGLLFPISSMPLAIQVVSFIVPGRYFIEALRGLFLKGSDLNVLWPQLLALAVFALFFSVVAGRKFKKRVA